MKATVIKEFLGVRDGEVIPVTFAPGDSVEGDLAVNAISGGWAEEVKAIKSAPENKARKQK